MLTSVLKEITNVTEFSLPGQILSSILIAFLVYLVFYYTGRRLLAGLTGTEFQKVRQIIRIPLLLCLLNLAILLPLTYHKYHQNGPLEHLLLVTLIFAVAWLLTRLIDFSRFFIFKRYNIETEDNLKARKVHTQLAILERVINILIIFIALTIAMMTFDSIRRIGLSLFASAGVAGIIIGFSAQKVLAGLIAGIQLAITQPIRVDDVVIVEGEWGWIEEIYLTYVVVRIWDKRRIILPSTYFIEKPFQNWTYKSADILGTVYLYTDYTVPFDDLREELDRLLEDNKLWDGQVKVMQVTDATENSVEIRILVSTKDSPTAWNLRVYLREQLIKFIQENYPESLPRTRVEFPGGKK